MVLRCRIARMNRARQLCTMAYTWRMVIMLSPSIKYSVNISAGAPADTAGFMIFSLRSPRHLTKLGRKTSDPSFLIQFRFPVRSESGDLGPDLRCQRLSESFVWGTLVHVVGTCSSRESSNPSDGALVGSGKRLWSDSQSLKVDSQSREQNHPDHLVQIFFRRKPLTRPIFTGGLIGNLQQLLQKLPL